MAGHLTKDERDCRGQLHHQSFAQNEIAKPVREKSRFPGRFSLGRELL